MATRIFDKGNKAPNELMTALVDTQEGDAVLEIGFGSGNAILEMANKVGGGVVEGIDFSDAMIKVAGKRNRHHIQRGAVRLIQGDFDTASYGNASFDAVCSANTVYFWPDPYATCSKIYSVLRPGGKVVLAFMDKSKMESKPLDMEVFSPVSCDDVRRFLENAGFSTVEFHQSQEGESNYCAVARKQQ